MGEGEHPSKYVHHLERNRSYTNNAKQRCLYRLGSAAKGWCNPMSSCSVIIYSCSLNFSLKRPVTGNFCSFLKWWKKTRKNSIGRSTVKKGQYRLALITWISTIVFLCACNLIHQNPHWKPTNLGHLGTTLGRCASSQTWPHLHLKMPRNGWEPTGTPAE